MSCVKDRRMTLRLVIQAKMIKIKPFFNSVRMEKQVMIFSCSFWPRKTILKSFWHIKAHFSFITVQNHQPCSIFFFHFIDEMSSKYRIGEDDLWERVCRIAGQLSTSFSFTLIKCCTCNCKFPVIFQCQTTYPRPFLSPSSWLDY